MRATTTRSRSRRSTSTWSADVRRVRGSLLDAAYGSTVRSVQLSRAQHLEIIVAGTGAMLGTTRKDAGLGSRWYRDNRLIAIGAETRSSSSAREVVELGGER